jgi:hypothetical protein
VERRTTDAEILRKYIKREVSTAGNTQWLVEKAAEGWSACETKDALRRGIKQHDCKVHWHQIARHGTDEYCAEVATLRTVKIWWPEEREETWLATYLKHRGDISHSRST